VNTPRLLDNDIRHAECRHPVDFLEPLPSQSEVAHRTCEVLRRTFGWVAEAGTIEQKGLRASVVLYCVRADLIAAATVEELGAQAGLPAHNVEILVADFCRTIGWE
jgi:hypothetical protein